MILIRLIGIISVIIVLFLFLLLMIHRNKFITHRNEWVYITRARLLEAVYLYNQKTGSDEISWTSDVYDYTYIYTRWWLWKPSNMFKNPENWEKVEPYYRR